MTGGSPAAGTGGNPPGPDDDDRPDSLAFTGIPALGLVALALSLLVIGGSMAYTARRRDEAATS